MTRAAGLLYSRSRVDLKPLRDLRAHAGDFRRAGCFFFVPSPMPLITLRGEPMIDVEGLTKFYGAFPAIQDLNFNARPGEIVEAVITDATAYDLYGGIIDPA